MTAEKLHDAIGLLPSDLIAETDRRRSGKPKIIPWKRYAALAACFALVLFASRFVLLLAAPKGAGAPRNEAAMDVSAAAAPMEEAADTAGTSVASEKGEPQNTIHRGEGLTSGFLEADWVLTPYGGAVSHSSEPYVTLATQAAELETYLLRRDFQDMSGLQGHAALQEEGWFERFDLVLVRLPLAEPELLEIRETEGGWTLLLPEPDTEAGSYHLLLTVEKGVVSNVETVCVVFG